MRGAVRGSMRGDELAWFRLSRRLSNATTRLRSKSRTQTAIVKKHSVRDVRLISCPIKILSESELLRSTLKNPHH